MITLFWYYHHKNLMKLIERRAQTSHSTQHPQKINVCNSHSTHSTNNDDIDDAFNSNNTSSSSLKLNNTVVPPNPFIVSSPNLIPWSSNISSLQPNSQSMQYNNNKQNVPSSNIYSAVAGTLSIPYSPNPDNNDYALNVMSDIPATEVRTALSDITTSSSGQSLDEDEEENFDSVSTRMQKNKKRKHKKERRHREHCKKHKNKMNRQRMSNSTTITFQPGKYIEPSLNPSALSNITSTIVVTTPQ